MTATTAVDQQAYADLLADIHRRLDELEALVEARFAALADEIRTRRLVVEDEAGNERITTTCDNDRTMLRVGIDDVNDDLGVGHQTDVTVYIEAELDRKGILDKLPAARAQVQCTTGDDAFAILDQRSTIDRDRWGTTVTDRGEVRLHQQRSQARPDAELRTTAFSIVEVGPDGVTDRTVGGDLLAYASMTRMPRGGAA